MDCTCQAPPSMGFFRQEYWGRLPFPSPGDLPNPGIEPGSPALLVDSLPSETQGGFITSDLSIQIFYFIMIQSWDFLTFFKSVLEF